jgi:hypothetical protein
LRALEKNGRPARAGSAATTRNNSASAARRLAAPMDARVAAPRKPLRGAEDALTSST